MNKVLKFEHISSNPNAKILVVFGGNEERRDAVINLLMSIENLTIYGTLSEEEGIVKMHDLGKVDIVLIGGRYTDQQRINIREIVAQNYPTASVTEPGVDYHYSNETIFNHINKLINKI